MGFSKTYREQLNHLQYTYGKGTHCNWVNNYIKEIVQPLPSSPVRKILPKDVYELIVKLNLNDLKTYRFDDCQRYNHIYDVSGKDSVGIMNAIFQELECNVLLFVEDIGLQTGAYDNLFVNTDFAEIVGSILYSRDEEYIVRMDGSFNLYAAKVDGYIVYVCPTVYGEEEKIAIAQELEGSYGAIVRLRDYSRNEVAVNNIMLPDVPIFDIIVKHVVPSAMRMNGTEVSERPMVVY